MTPYYDLDPNEMDPGSGAQDAAYLLRKIDQWNGLSEFLDVFGPAAFEYHSDLYYAAVDAREAVKQLDTCLTQWARERGVSR